MSEHIDPTAQRVNPPTRVPLKIEAGFVMLADAVDPQAYADRF